MFRADTIILIQDSPTVHGIYEQVSDVRREVMAEIRSVGRTEAYQAMSQGLAPAYVFRIAHAFEYEGEKRVIYHGQEYRVIRAFTGTDDAIELTVERNADGGAS